MKELRVNDVMSQAYTTIHAFASIIDVIDKLANLSTRATGYRGFSLIVVDEVGQPVGIISIFDVFFHLRPAFLNYGVNAFSLAKEEMRSYVEEFKTLTAEQIMHSPVMTCSPDDLIMEIVDRMVRQRHRRLPVVKNSAIIGVVYLSDLFAIMSKTWLCFNTD